MQKSKKGMTMAEWIERERRNPAFAHRPAADLEGFLEGVEGAVMFLVEYDRVETIEERAAMMELFVAAWEYIQRENHISRLSRRKHPDFCEEVELAKKCEVVGVEYLTMLYGLIAASEARLGRLAAANRALME